MTDRSTTAAILRISTAGACVGAVYSALAHSELGTGLVIGAVNGAAIPWLEIVALRGWAAPALSRLPFIVTVAVRAGLFFGAVVLINAVFVPLLNGFRLAGAMAPQDIVFGLAASFIGSSTIGVADLLGIDVLLAFVAGRYHRPRLEERALLFLDVCASTATAERLGGPRFLDFLNAVFADLTTSIAENGGEIHKYVGDEIIATWRLAPGGNAPDIVRAWASARRRIAAGAERYQRDFGLAPDFRAALHAGEVVVGELGSHRKEIALIGDPMNTAARIIEACRALNRPALASAALMERLDAPSDGIDVAAIAPFPLRGKSAPLELVALALEQMHAPERRLA